MPLFAGNSRDDLRAIWREAWRKHRERLPLAPLEAQLVDLIRAHPEYHAELEQDTGGNSQPSGTSPYLHLGLHAAVREGLATDRPAGIRAAYEAVLATCPTAHDAEHVLLECLGETLWDAQRAGRPPDETAYLECVRRRVMTR